LSSFPAPPLTVLGYGEASLDPEWPHDAKIAISFILNYEEGAERTILNGDSQSEPYLWEKGASGTFVSGARHASAESEFEYGSRVGCWRILRLFKEMGWQFTSWACGQALEKNSTFAKAMVRDGHEVAAHGWRWLEIWEMGVQEEKEYMRRNCEAIEKLTGKLPKGVFFGRGTPNTKALFPEVVRECGGELLYSSETAFNDDVPYWIDLPAEKELKDGEKKGLLIVPYNYDCNGKSTSSYFIFQPLCTETSSDGKFHMSPGFVGSAMYLDYLKSTFDMLYREGCNGTPKLMNIPMHSRIVGKPGRAEALRTFMLYVKEHEGVWVATREEIARHFKEKFPYSPGCLVRGRKIGL
jgi:peptidoglycan/xylan/chitin deacetylase (PgdA/CDA1 family)